MPIYEYTCLECGVIIEKIQKAGARPPRKCEQCGGKMKKLISRTSFQLKGGGWFASGYSSSGKTGTSPASTAGEPSSGGKAAASDPKKSSSGSD